MINASGLLSLMFTLGFLYLADRRGRKFVMVVVGPVGMLGLSLSLIFDSLIMVTVHMIFAHIFYPSFFMILYIYFNETFIDPWRSKSAGLNLLFTLLGKYGE